MGRESILVKRRGVVSSLRLENIPLKERKRKKGYSGRDLGIIYVVHVSYSATESDKHRGIIHFMYKTKPLGTWRIPQGTLSETLEVFFCHE